MFKFILLILLFITGCSSNIEVEESVTSIPVQNDIEKKLFYLNGYSIEKVSEYQIEAVILSKKEYSDSTADLVPFDLALGWGPMSEQSLVDKLEISQSGRWYRYKYKEEVNIKDVSENSANTHIIPYNDYIKDSINNFGVGDKISLKGYLVNFTDSYGRFYKSSVSRSDVGAGACEIFLVEEIIPRNGES